METNAYPCRSNYFCKTEFKAKHTHVHTKHFWLQGYTYFCIQHSSPLILLSTLHSLSCHNTRPSGRDFLLLSVLLLKFWTSSQTAGHVFFVNMLSKIGHSNYIIFIMAPLFPNGNLLDNYSLNTTQFILTASYLHKF